ncbi:MAG: hypothetical protein DLM52_06880 [Chthoniobacterales bacterium]|nr:MAG: hypothetical protein DLM52_06880 [Chthoniobacterales bacterium]
MAETLSIKVPLATKVRLRRVARDRHTTPSSLLREAVDLVLAGKSANGKVSLYELNRDLFEKTVSVAPRDLSTNPKYLNDFGKCRRR